MYIHIQNGITGNIQKLEVTQVTTDRWTGKQNVVYTHTAEYYSALKKKEPLTHATKWINLEDIMLSEMSQSQNDKYCMILLIWSKYSSQICRDKVELVIARGWERREQSVVL